MSSMDSHVDNLVFRRRIMMLVFFLAMLPAAAGGLGILKNTFVKMPASKVEHELRAWSRFGYFDAKADIKCGEGISQWHYVCTIASPGQRPTRKIGVRVDATHLTKVSRPADINARYILD